ncbi:HAD family hydrolase [Streptomyces sp. BR1]|uniref:HAD family hydrolase n=1 Tax=Streptomyces sp. BR1 TaxID=1592323 RepID=UPI00402B738A
MTGAPMPGVRGLVLDLDGTLADTPQAIATITLKVLAARGVDADESIVRPLIGKPLDQNFATLLGCAPEDAEVAAAVAEYQSQFRAHLQGIAPEELAYPDVPDALQHLRTRGVLLGLATSKPRGAAERMLRLMGVYELFHVVAGHDSVQRGKPDPEMALLVADGLGLTPAQCVVVGDGVADAGMGRAAGMRVVGVSYGVAGAAELMAAGAERVVDSFGELTVLVTDRV